MVLALEQKHLLHIDRVSIRASFENVFFFLSSLSLFVLFLFSNFQHLLVFNSHLNLNRFSNYQHEPEHQHDQFVSNYCSAFASILCFNNVHVHVHVYIVLRLLKENRELNKLKIKMNQRMKGTVHQRTLFTLLFCCFTYSWSGFQFCFSNTYICASRCPLMTWTSSISLRIVNSGLDVYFSVEPIS